LLLLASSPLFIIISDEMSCHFVLINQKKSVQFIPPPITSHPTHVPVPTAGLAQHRFYAIDFTGPAPFDISRWQMSVKP
jgi:hypothetical protein